MPGFSITLTPELAFWLGIEFLLLASMLGGIMRTVFVTLLAWRLARLAMLPVAGLGLLALLR